MASRKGESEVPAGCWPAISICPPGGAASRALYPLSSERFSAGRNKNSSLALPRGCSHFEDLARIEDVLRIERALEALHQRDLGLIPRPTKIGALLEPDAVLGRNRAAALPERIVDHL